MQFIDKKTSTIDSLGIFFLGLLIFTFGLFQAEIISFESRFYLFAQEMLRHGPDFFPHSYYEPYPDYPGTSTFLIYLCARLAGGLNKGIAVLPSAIASAFTLIVTYFIGALHSRRWGLYAAGFLLFNSAFIQEARTISLDMYVTFFTALCFYLVYSAELLRCPRRCIWLPVLWLLGFAIRGPIGLIIPTAVVCMFYLVERKFKYVLLWGCLAVLLLMAGIGLLLLLAYHTGGMNFAHHVLTMEIISRIHDAHSPEHTYYFFASLAAMAVTFPLVVLMLPGLYNSSRDRFFLLQILAWILIIIFGMSLAADKKIRYILPLAPALALFAAYLLAVRPVNVYSRNLRICFLNFCLVIPLLSFIVVSLVFLKKPEWQFAYLPICFILIMSQFLMLNKKPSIIFINALMVFIAMHLFVYEPIYLRLNQTRIFVNEVELERNIHNAQLIFFQESRDGNVIKYLINTPKEVHPLFMDQAEQILQYEQPAFFIASLEHFQKLSETIRQQFSIVSQGKIGTDQIVVFRKGPL